MKEAFVNILLVLLSGLAVVYLSTICHECGHALAGRWCGLRVPSFGLGVERPFLTISWGKTRFYLCCVKPLQGITFIVSPQSFPRRLSLVVMLLGGALAQALLAASAVVAWRLLPWGSAVWV